MPKKYRSMEETNIKVIKSLFVCIGIFVIIMAFMAGLFMAIFDWENVRLTSAGLAGLIALLIFGVLLILSPKIYNRVMKVTESQPKVKEVMNWAKLNLPYISLIVGIISLIVGITSLPTMIPIGGGIIVWSVIFIIGWVSRRRKEKTHLENKPKSVKEIKYPKSEEKRETS